MKTSKNLNNDFLTNKNKSLRYPVEDLEGKNINFIQGYCPIMLLPKIRFLHNLQEFFLKMAGIYSF